MRPVDWRAVRAAAHSIRQRAAGDATWDRIRYDMADEIGMDIATVLEEDHGIRLVTSEDWLRLAGLDAALAGADGDRR